ncbi:NAD(P)-dependent oxidoreductase [Hyalangium rubrum]|uniref:SDR family oxidoreductase n=1 Tax=Hyalangium rubrum TaxID=3103134 RepID=A0ABU5GXE4_9BACT|nr:SDR family oxidoreductase [Hyalangium sp. s54d21]MDY7225761.1 SDR family oxidoreductase [Hyalangium sp. s54d21]
MDDSDDMLSISVMGRGNAVAYGPTREQKPEEHTVPLLILGATGRTGRYLVEQALSAGHTVTALVRDPHSLDIRHPRLHILQGDALSPETVDKAMLGQRTVLSALGFSGRRAGEALAKATENIVAAMQKYRVHRLICLAPPPTKEGWARRGLLGKLLAPFLQKNAPPDWERQLDSLRGSPLEWVLVRPTQLTDEPARGAYQVSVGWAEVPEGISRADVATFMLEQLRSRRYVRLSPVLGG